MIFRDGYSYLLILLYLWLIVLLESSNGFSKFRKISFIFSSCILFLMIGCRWETGTDWNSYYALFNDIDLSWLFLLANNSFDVGYLLLNGIVRLFTDNYVIFLLINAGITIFFLSKLLIKISPYPNLSLFFFYTNFMMSHFMGSNRRMMSLVFILWMYYFVFQKNRKGYLLSLGCGFAFHRSSLVNAISLFVSTDYYSIRKTVLCLCTALLVGILQLPVRLMELGGLVLSSVFNNPIIDKMLFYSDTEEAEMTYSTGSLLLSTTLAVIKRSILLIFYIYILKRYKVDKLTAFLFNLYVIGFIGYLCFIGSFFQILTTYFALVEVILIARMYSYTTGKFKLLFCMLLSLYGFIQLVNSLSVYPELYVPYLPFWAIS